jgi:hypothetical protein
LGWEERCVSSTGRADKEPILNSRKQSKKEEGIAIGKSYKKREGEEHIESRTKSEMRGWQKKKADSRIKGEESCWAQEGRMSSRGSYRRTAPGNGTAVTVWGRRIEVGASKRAVS